MKAPAEEVLALMDSCVVRFTEPYTEEAAHTCWNVPKPA